MIIKKIKDVADKAPELLQKARALGIRPATVLLEAADENADIHQSLCDSGSLVQYHSNSTARRKFDPEFYTRLILKAAAHYQTGVVWYCTDDDIKIYGARCAAGLNALSIFDAFDLKSDNGKMAVKRMACAGKVIEKITIHEEKAVIGFKAKSFPIPHSLMKGKLEPIHLNVEETSTVLEIKEITQSLKENIDLSSADIVVGIGRGAKNKEGVAFVQKFAESIKAAFGGSRAIIDAELLPSHLQIGQTGKIISPRLYICVGVSGAVQHVAGINHSKIILAINSDPDAPIFKIANYGIVGDLFDILPLLEGQMKNLLNAG